MAFSLTGLSLIVEGGFSGTAPRMWHYKSADAAGTVAGTGYFARMGEGSRWPSSLANTTSGNEGGLRAPAGLRVGDLMLVQETTGGANPGRTTLHSVLSATADQASTSASTGFAAGYNCTITAT